MKKAILILLVILILSINLAQSVLAQSSTKSGQTKVQAIVEDIKLNSNAGYINKNPLSPTKQIDLKVTSNTKELIENMRKEIKQKLDIAGSKEELNTTSTLVNSFTLSSSYLWLVMVFVVLTLVFLLILFFKKRKS